MDFEVLEVFRQKIGDIYHFDILAVSSNLNNSATLGYVVFNSKTGEAYYCTTRHINDDNMKQLVKDIKAQVVSLEKYFQ